MSLVKSAAPRIIHSPLDLDFDDSEVPFVTAWDLSTDSNSSEIMAIGLALYLALPAEEQTSLWARESRTSSLRN